jgi:hypothetical protein
LPAPPRRPRNVARKRVAKKLKVPRGKLLEYGSRVLISRCFVC